MPPLSPRQACAPAHRIRKKIGENGGQKQHIDIGLGKIALLNVDFLYEMPESHIDEGACDGIVDLVDQS